MNSIKILLFAWFLSFSTCFSSESSPYVPLEKKESIAIAKNIISDAIAIRKGTRCFLTVLGVGSKVELIKGDSKYLTVRLGNNDFDIDWNKIPANEMANLIKETMNKANEDVVKYIDFCVSNDLISKAEDGLIMAQSLDKKISNDSLLRARYIASLSPKIGSSVIKQEKILDPTIKSPLKITYRKSTPDSLVPINEVSSVVDNIIEIDLAEMGMNPAELCDDPTFLRRASLDITGQIPSADEVFQFFSDSNPNKRSKKINELLQRPDYADNLATFWSVLLIGRKTREEPDVKPKAFRSWLREEFNKNTPYDQIVMDVLTSSGSNEKVPQVNYLTHTIDDTLPITMGNITQTFLGSRISCAQCHDHPFDKWTQTDFWGFATFMAYTRSERRELKDDPKDPTKVTKRWHVLTDQNNRGTGPKFDPPQNNLKLDAKFLDGSTFAPSFVPVSIKNSIPKKEMREMNKAGENDSNYKPEEHLGYYYRTAMAKWITEQERFDQSCVNRTWRAMFGYGLVEPIDDIRPKNPASHPEVLSILSSEFKASNRDMKRLIAIIANTKAYQRSSLGAMDKIVRFNLVRNAGRAEVRPMTPEMLFSAIIKASEGEEKSRAFSASLRSNDEGQGMMNSMINTNEGNSLINLMQRFINTSVAEDKAGKLQFEGTVSQALMMMHSNFANKAVENGIGILRKSGKDDMIHVFASILGRPPTEKEIFILRNFLVENSLKDLTWVLLNSSEFVTIH